MTDTNSTADDEQQRSDLPLRELMPDEVDHRALQMWIEDFLYESPPKTDREYKGLSWADEERWSGEGPRPNA